MNRREIDLAGDVRTMPDAAEILPGRFALAVRATETSAARIDFAIAHREVVRLVLDTVNRLNVGETVTLSSPVLPFELRLHLRFKEDSRLILDTDIEGIPRSFVLSVFAVR